MEKGVNNILRGLFLVMFSSFPSVLEPLVIQNHPNVIEMIYFVDIISSISCAMGLFIIIAGIGGVIFSEGNYVRGAVGTIVTKEEENETSLINFGCIELNTIVEQIKEKILFLKNNETLKGDMEALLMIEQMEKTYLTKIFNDYISIPKEKRNINTEKGNPYNNTVSQLKTILQGLSNIEDKIVSNSIMKQKANSIFLKEKVASM